MYPPAAGTMRGLVVDVGVGVEVPVTIGTNETKGPAELEGNVVLGGLTELLEVVGAKEVSVKMLSLIDVETNTDVVTITFVLLIVDPSIWL